MACASWKRLYHNLKNTPMGDELKWLLKEGGGHTFESCDISLENTPTSHAFSDECSQAFPVLIFVDLPIPCIIVNANGKSKWGRPGTEATPCPICVTHAVILQCLLQ